MRGHRELSTLSNGYYMSYLPALIVGAEDSIFSDESIVWTGEQTLDAEVEICPADEGAAYLICCENLVKFNVLVSAFLT